MLTEGLSTGISQWNFAYLAGGRAGGQDMHDVIMMCSHIVK
jgi:hypothetical protein